MSDVSLPQDSQPRAARRSRGAPLSAGRIAAEAMSLIDTQGLEAFSFRALASLLGCQAMSIYHYFPSKTHLYETLVEVLLVEASTMSEAGPWQDQLREAAAAYRRMALNHLGFFPYFATFRLNNRSGLTYLERFVRIFETAGLAEEARARHFRLIGFYLVGACLDEVVGKSKGPSASNPMPFQEARLAFPSIMAVGPYLGADRSQATFDAGIEILIRCIEADATP